LLPPELPPRELPPRERALLPRDELFRVVVLRLDLAALPPLLDFAAAGLRAPELDFEADLPDEDFVDERDDELLLFARDDDERELPVLLRDELPRDEDPRPDELPRPELLPPDVAVAPSIGHLPESTF